MYCFCIGTANKGTVSIKIKNKNNTITTTTTNNYLIECKRFRTTDHTVKTLIGTDNIIYWTIKPDIDWKLTVLFSYSFIDWIVI